MGLDNDYNTYNINADDAACAIARAVKAEKLAFLTDIEGVCKDPADQKHADLRASCDGRPGLIGQRQYWWRHAAKAQELH